MILWAGIFASRLAIRLFLVENTFAERSVTWDYASHADGFQLNLSTVLADQLKLILLSTVRQLSLHVGILVRRYFHAVISAL